MAPATPDTFWCPSFLHGGSFYHCKNIGYICDWMSTGIRNPSCEGRGSVGLEWFSFRCLPNLVSWCDLHRCVASPFRTRNACLNLTIICRLSCIDTTFMAFVVTPAPNPNITITPGRSKKEG